MQTVPVGVQSARAAFFERHGHRAIREAELRSKGWADDERAFIEYLRTVIAGGALCTPTGTVCM